MKTLYQLAFEAVPNKGLMAETFLVPWHPVAKELQAQQYIEDRNKYKQEHCVNFRKCLTQLKLQRWNTYCHKTEWIAIKYGEDGRCQHCKKIRTTGLTLDGLQNVCDKSRIAISVDQPNGFLLIKETVHSV
ncbi:unnamed protein product [Porites evermanni]|uniref:Zinc-ribbon domain-containing protein n=1 Tax=Porites evermanni TaxID=104178 RepID=A0ABN8MBM7_9CNID|nr:unnamed protein product [Porites evermanni]CAH3027264.1 unnamed protein product [Porites evermanni]